MKDLSMPRKRVQVDVTSLMHFRGAKPRTKASTPQFQKRPLQEKVSFEDINDTQTGMPLGIPRGARCVQRFDDSRNSAIHITYRISLRSSSMREPRDPLLKVVYMITFTK